MPAPKPGAKKDSTNDLPMFDLEESIRFITTIHEKALETAQMPDVAKGCGYKHATSTPFYRRQVSSRLFGLLSKTGAQLTVRARDYLRPDAPGIQKKSLEDAILSIQPYAEAIERLKGTKFNVDLIANGFTRTLNLTDSCAMICAKAFESSLKFAGFLTVDSLVSTNGAVVTKSKPPDNEKLEAERLKRIKETQEDAETQTHTIYLDKTKLRKFEVTAPIDITASELARAKGFLDFALIVDQEVPVKGKEESVL